MKKIFCTLCIVFLVVVVFAQATPEESNILKMLEQSKIYYNNGEYEKAIAELEKALNVLYKLKQNDRVEAYKYLGFSYVAFGDILKAKESFKKALSLNPQLTLDEATVSPKIIQVFEQAKIEMPKTVIVDTVQEEPTYKAVDYTGATWRSALLPGWGQMYKGDGNKGAVLMVSFLSCLSGMVVSAIVESRAHEKYREDPSKYSAYNFWHNMTMWMLVGTGGTWTFGVVDAALVRPSSRTAYNFNDKSQVVLYPEGEKICIGYVRKF